MSDSVITEKENTSKDWNCIIIILMFLTSFLWWKQVGNHVADH